MFVQPLHVSPISLIVNGIRACYDSYGNSDSFFSDSGEYFLGEKDKALIVKIIESGHHSVLEHQAYTFHIDGISRSCHDDKTEILTKYGYKLFKDLNENDLIATLNPETHNIEYYKYDEFISYKYDGEMIIGESTKFNFCVTPNHNMYVSEGYGIGSKKTKIIKRPFAFKTAEEIYNKTGYFYLSSNWVGKLPSPYFNIPAIKYTKRNRNNISISTRYSNNRNFNTKAFLKFVGRYIGDGCIYYHDGHYKINISGHINEKEEIIDIIKNIGFTPKIVYHKGKNSIDVFFYDMTLFKWLEINVLKNANNKRIPFEFLEYNKEHLAFLYEGLFGSDGQIRDGYSDSYTTTSKLLSDQVQELVMKLGRSSRVRHSINRKTNFGILENCYTVETRTKNFNTPAYNRRNPTDRLRKINYNGMVYCVNVKNHIINTRRNGEAMWSGNCLQELSRHRIGVSPSVKSTRYTLKQLKNEEPFIDYIINDKSTTTIMHHDRAKKYIVYTDDSYVDNFSIKALENIRLVVDSNTPNDIAKYCLPESFKTSGQYTFNARSLIHLFELRMSPRALKEFRELACCIYFSIPDDYKFMFTNYINKEYIENYRNNKNVL